MPGRNSSDSVFIVDGVRTVMGNPYGSLRDYTAVELATIVIKEILRRNKIDKNLIKEVIFGNVVSAGIGQNLSRQAAIFAGLPDEVPSYTVNSVCGAGLQSVISAAQAILTKNADLSIAGGAESATHSPYFVKRAEAESQGEMGPVDTLQHDGLLCQITGQSMGELVEGLASKYEISREEQDAYSFRSHRKACLAQKQNKFSKEIVPIRNPKKKPILKDDRPRKNLDIKWLEKLPPVFWTGGSVTAGNSSLSCDGAAAVLLASKSFVKKHNIKPRAQIYGYASIGIKPELTFESAVEAVKACLKKCRLSVKDIDLFEIGEAFASQMILTKNKLKIPDEKLNIYGGDIAFGHPLGAAGTRTLVTLMNALHRRKANKGLACVSYGGGGAIAVMIKAVK